MCFSVYWILIYISVILAVSSESSAKPDMKNMKLICVLCQMLSCYQSQGCVFPLRQTNPSAPVGNLNALCKHWTKTLLRIEANKPNPKFRFRVVYLKEPITSTQGAQHHSAHCRRNRVCQTVTPETMVPTQHSGSRWGEPKLWLLSGSWFYSS